MHPLSDFDSHRFIPFSLTYNDDSYVVFHVRSRCVMYSLDVRSGTKVELIDL